MLAIERRTARARSVTPSRVGRSLRQESSVLSSVAAVIGVVGSRPSRWRDGAGGAYIGGHHFSHSSRQPATGQLSRAARMLPGAAAAGVWLALSLLAISPVPAPAAVCSTSPLFKCATKEKPNCCQMREDVWTCMNITQKCCPQSLSHGNGAVCGAAQQCCAGFSEMSCFDNATEICCFGNYGLPCPKADKCGGSTIDPKCAPQLGLAAVPRQLSRAPPPHQNTYRVAMKLGEPGGPTVAAPFRCETDLFGHLVCHGVACSNGACACRSLRALWNAHGTTEPPEQTSYILASVQTLTAVRCWCTGCIAINATYSIAAPPADCSWNVQEPCPALPTIKSSNCNGLLGTDYTSMSVKLTANLAASLMNNCTDSFM